MNYENENILVLGAGKSGLGVAQVLQRLGARVTVNDKNFFSADTPWVQELENNGIRVVTGVQDNELLRGVTRIVVSPGIPLTIAMLVEAKRLAIPVHSEVEIAGEIATAPILGITGTNGKTTATSLLGAVLQEAGKSIVIGGNIGLSLSEAVFQRQSESQALDYIVAELSSYQLEGIETFHPKGAIILNLTPDHLARHKTMENYGRAKERIFRNETAEDFLALNRDDETVVEMAARSEATIVWFSRKETVQDGAYFDKGNLYAAQDGNATFICKSTELQIKGIHNIENVLAVIALAFRLGIDANIIGCAVKKFEGVVHRLEYVQQKNGVLYYNDSKATNPDSTIKALESFDGRIILLAGGADKGTELVDLMQIVAKRVIHLILFGAAAPRFAVAAQENGVSSVECVQTVSEAVHLASSLAKEGDIVLLSPACASFDQYTCFEERGDDFKKLVNELEGI